MSEVGPWGAGAGGPFGDLMRDLARLLTTQGPLNWEVAKQLAQWSATGGQPEVNPDPLSRVRMEELLRIAEMHVTNVTGWEPAGGRPLTVLAVTPSGWALHTLEAWRPTFEKLATAMTPAPEADAGPSAAMGADPMGQLFGNLPQVLGPLLFGMQAGSMVGQLAATAMGQYDLPMPRPPADEIMMVPAAIDHFAGEWTLDADDVRLWICLREVTNHAILGRPHVRARLDGLIGDYVAAFDPDPSALESRLAGLDPTDMAAMQSIFGDPSALIGDVQSDAQRQLQVPLRTLLTAVVGYVDHVMDTVGRRLIGSYGPLTEALRRRRLEDNEGARILGQLLGVTLDAATYERGQAFCRGVLERAGEDGLARLWQSAEDLPTPAEIDAPGLWLARIDLHA
ncbi:MAG: zinc-dependent metalloprotease [Actinomycetota bacterium]|nr:zinc-dependent metalloprotease [Actinomycetota bacterium]